MKRFNHYHWLQFYVYDFMYIDDETPSEEEYFPDTNKFVYNCKKRSTTVPVPKNWIRFNYICSKYYE